MSKADKNLKIMKKRLKVLWRNLRKLAPEEITKRIELLEMIRACEESIKDLEK